MRLKFRMWFKYGRKAQKLLTQASPWVWWQSARRPFMAYGACLRKFKCEPTLKKGIFWIQSDQCGHSEWNIAIGSAGEYLSRNRFERAESFSDRFEKGKYRSLKCWNPEYYHPSEVHPHTSAICMHTMFEQAPISGLTITCMKTVLEHGSFYIIPFILTGFICQKFHAESHPGKKVKLALFKLPLLSIFSIFTKK